MGSSYTSCSQHPSSVEPPHSTYSFCPTSPFQHSGKVRNKSVSHRQHQITGSPIRRPSSGPTLEDIVPQADGDQPHSAPPFSSSLCVSADHKRPSMTSNETFSLCRQRFESGKCFSADSLHKWWT